MQIEKEALKKKNLEPSLVSKIIDVIYRRLWLIIIFIILGVAVGGIYGKARNREYVVYHDVGFTAQNTASFQTLRAGESIDVDNPSGTLYNGKQYFISDKGYRYVKDVDSYYQIDETDGGYKIKDNDAIHINTANKYIDTVVEFFNTGVVVDRANFYYNQFEELYKEKAKDDSNLSKSVFLQQYIDTISEIKISDENLKNKVGEWFDVCLYKKDDKCQIKKLCFKGFEEGTNNLKFVESTGITQVVLPRFENANSPIDSILYLKYTNDYTRYDASVSEQDNGLYSKNNIVGSKIKTVYDVDDKKVNYDFSIGYQDATAELAQEKLIFIILATKQEVKTYADNYDALADRTKAVDYKYFNIVSINIIDLGFGQTETNISTKKLIVIFGACGLAVGLIFIYVLSLFDFTVDSKKELEKITGVSVLAVIEQVNEEGKKNG